MKKVIFTLSCIGLGLVSVSCSTDAYDLPETNELRDLNSQEQLELVLEEEFSNEEDNSNYNVNNLDEETTGTNDESTDPIVGGPKKD